MTSGAIVKDFDMISKIRARHGTRNRELYTGQWADTRSSRVREQQVVRQKPRRVSRPPHRTFPVHLGLDHAFSGVLEAIIIMTN